MALQSTYGSNIAAAVAGAQATEIPATILSRTVETVAGIGFGVPVEQGAADKGCKVFDGGTVLGITALDRGATGTDGYVDNESARVMVKGDLWVVCTTGCAAGDPVYVRPSNNTLQNSTANSGVQIANARWETTASAGELAVVRLG